MSSTQKDEGTSGYKPYSEAVEFFKKELFEDGHGNPFYKNFDEKVAVIGRYLRKWDEDMTKLCENLEPGDELLKNRIEICRRRTVEEVSKIIEEIAEKKKAHDEKKKRKEAEEKSEEDDKKKYKMRKFSMEASSSKDN